MKCKNCNAEMIDADRFTFWCPDCGTLVMEDWENTWHYPKSVETVKILAKRLGETQDKYLHTSSRLNGIMRADEDRIDWGDDERR